MNKKIYSVGDKVIGTIDKDGELLVLPFNGKIDADNYQRIGFVTKVGKDSIEVTIPIPKAERQNNAPQK